MEKPVLVVLAAGMGSRYGGLKQIDPVGPEGELIIDYSIFDAVRAGFKKVVFIIKEELEQSFREAIGNRVSESIEVEYAFQKLNQLPAGFSVPEGREKPWGTTHAVMSIKDIVTGPFAVINADDYYGPAAFDTIYKFLTAEKPQDGKSHYAMVGYHLQNTVTDKGSVARGVCQANDEGYLTAIVERTKIEKTENGARFTEDDGATWTDIPGNTLVSMNFWGFDENFIAAAEAGFAAFLTENLPKNPMKCEYLLPFSVDQLIKAGKADVSVLSSKDRWHGVTYKEDKPEVVASISALHQQGLYPTPLWRNMG